MANVCKQTQNMKVVIGANEKMPPKTVPLCFCTGTGTEVVLSGYPGPYRPSRPVRPYKRIRARHGLIAIRLTQIFKIRSLFLNSNVLPDFKIRN